MQRRERASASQEGARAGTFGGLVVAGIADLAGRQRQAAATHGGHAVHVGGGDDCIAIYNGNPNAALAELGSSCSTRMGLNHSGVLVDDHDQTEARVKAAGFVPHSHSDYEPSRRFYFDGPESLEIEVVSFE